ncbi:MAG: hypothetical protein ACTSYI_11040 [Promethearchaeota archaeon]
MAIDPTYTQKNLDDFLHSARINTSDKPNLSLIKGTTPNQFPCMGCQLDQFFKKMNLLPSDWSHEVSTLEALHFEVGILYKFVLISGQLNLMGNLTPFLFHADNINHFLTGYLARKQFQAQLSKTKLKKIYGLFKKLATFFEEKGYLSSEAKESLMVDLWPFKKVRTVFSENHLEYCSEEGLSVGVKKQNQISTKNKTKSKIKRSFPVYISEDTYRKDLQQNGCVPDDFCTKFAYELAEMYRTNLTRLIAQFGFPVDYISDYLTFFIHFARFGEEISQMVYKKEGQFQRLSEIYFYYLFQNPSLLSLLWVVNFHLEPKEMGDFFCDGLNIFLEKSCKKCHYACLFDE